jgi:hypothetical protein
MAARRSIPEPFHVPKVSDAVEVEVPDGASTRFDPPVLAIATVGPPAAFDLPSSDHIGDLVALASPLERTGHTGVTLDPDLLVESFRHLTDLTDRMDRHTLNRTCVR